MSDCSGRLTAAPTSGSQSWCASCRNVGCELVVVVHVSGGRQDSGNSRYLWIGVFQATSFPVGSAGSGGFAGGVMSVGVRQKREPAAGMSISAVSQRTEDGGVQGPSHVVADPVDERSGAGRERAVVSRADDGGACRSV